MNRFLKAGIGVLAVVTVFAGTASAKTEELPKRNIPGVSDSAVDTRLRKACDGWNGESEIDIDVSDLNISVNYIDESKEHLLVFAQENGNYFFIKGYSVLYSPTKIVKMRFTCDERFKKEDKAKFDRAVTKALSGIDDKMNDTEKLLYLHDYLVTNTDYTADLHTAYDCLVSGKAVCSGYAWAFDYLCSKVGIPCEYVISDGMNHAWNMVTVGNKKYFVDCTWDDPVADKGDSGEFLLTTPTHCDYECFLVNGTELSKTHDSDDWYINSTGASCSSACTDTSYQKLDWHNSRGAMARVGEHEWAYINPKSQNVRSYNFKSGKTSDIGTIPEPAPLYYSIAHVPYGVVVSTFSSVYLVDNEGTETILSLSSSDRSRSGSILGFTKNREKLTLYKYRTVIQAAGKEIITVPIYADGIDLEKVPDSLIKGQTISPEYKLSPDYCMVKTATFSTSDENVLISNNDGSVTATGAGKVLLYVTADDKKHLQVSKTIEVFELIKPEVTAATGKFGASLSWAPDPHAESYEVQRKSGDGEYQTVYTGSEAEFTDKNIEDNTLYTYAVRSVAAGVRGEASETNVIHDSSLNISAANDSKGILITLDSDESYTLMRRARGGNWQDIGNINGRYTDKKAVKGTGYEYGIRLENGQIESSGMLVRLVAGKMSFANTSKGISISWKQVPGATGYRIYRVSGKKVKLAGKIKSGDITDFTDKYTAGRYGKTFTYQIKAIAENSESTAKSGSYMRLAAVKPGSVSKTSEGIKVSWTPDKYAEGYEISFVTGKKTKTFKVSGKGISEYSAKGLAKGKKYKISIRSFSGKKKAVSYGEWSVSKQVKY